jgi:glycerol uptake facilitator protein
MINSANLGEFAGTLMLILLGNGVVANVVLNKTKGNNSGWIVITAGWAFAVMVGVMVAKKFGSADAHLNPAVTLGAAIFKGEYEKLSYIVFQILGAMVGSTLVWLAYRPHWEETEDAAAKLACFSTGPAIRNTSHNLISEIIGTIVLVIGANSIAAPEGLAPYLVGILVWSIGLSLGGPTGYALNPARDLGPRIAHHFLPIVGKGNSDWEYAWIPVTGPIIGVLIASALLMLCGL